MWFGSVSELWLLSEDELESALVAGRRPSEKAVRSPGKRAAARAGVAFYSGAEWRRACIEFPALRDQPQQTHCTDICSRFASGKTCEVSARGVENTCCLLTPSNENPTQGKSFCWPRNPKHLELQNVDKVYLNTSWFLLSLCQVWRSQENTEIWHLPFTSANPGEDSQAWWGGGGLNSEAAETWRTSSMAHRTDTASHSSGRCLQRQQVPPT